MDAARPILAAIIVFSLILLPATPQATIVSLNPIQVAMHSDGDMPCCPCCSRDQDNSKALAACVIKCLSTFAAVLPAATVFSLNPLTFQFSLADRSLRPHVSSPPTHPPTA